MAARLAMLPRLEKASKTVARAGRALLDALAAAETSKDRLDVAVLWSAVETVAPRAVVAEAIGLVEELDPDMRPTIERRSAAAAALLAAGPAGPAGADGADGAAAPAG